MSKLAAFVNEAVSSLNGRIDLILSEQPSLTVHANEAHGEKPRFDFSERLDEVASRQAHSSHEQEVALRDLTDRIAEALHEMNAQVQRSSTCLNVLDRNFQHRIRRFEEDQGQLRALVVELQSEVKMRSKQTDDAVAELRDKFAKVLCNSYEQSAMPFCSQQTSGAVSPPYARMSPSASPGATPPRSQHLCAGQSMRPGTPRQLAPWGSQPGQSGDIHRASEAMHVPPPKVTTLASQLSHGMMPADVVAEMVVHTPEIAATGTVAAQYHGGSLSGSQSIPRLASNLQQRQQQSLQHVQARGLSRQSNKGGTFLV